MQQTVLLKDKTATGKLINQFPVFFDRQEITVQDLIMARVKAEVEEYNNKMPEYYCGLVQPSNAEKVLNGYKIKDRKIIDVEKQSYVALDAFQKNGYFILVNDKQVSHLDETVLLMPDTTISFVKLTPLVGG